jgi:flavin-dependent dehydrogenase
VEVNASVDPTGPETPALTTEAVGPEKFIRPRLSVHLLFSLPTTTDSPPDRHPVAKSATSRLGRVLPMSQSTPSAPPAPPAPPIDTDSHHDVVVVGARCAGAATAMLLAGAAHDVVLVDRAPLPSDTLSTHAIARGGVVQLHRWGLLDRLLATGAPPVRAVSFHLGGHVKRRDVRSSAGVDLLVAPRRLPLDTLLAQAAVEAGAQLLERTSAVGLVRDGSGRVRGVRTRSSGTERTLHASLVVGADGVHSRVARWAGARTEASHAPGGGVLYAYLAGVGAEGYEFHVAPDALTGVFPTHGDEACVWLGRPAAALQPLLRAGDHRPAAWLAAVQALAPDLAPRISLAGLRSPVRGAVGLPNVLRVPVGPGWALVGDAGYHRDPITGHGITDAFRDAELLANAAHRSLTDPSSEGDAMTEFHRTRNASLAEIFDLTRRIGAFPQPETFAALQVALGQALDREAVVLASRGPLPGAADAAA